MKRLKAILHRLILLHFQCDERWDETAERATQQADETIAYVRSLQSSHK